MGSLSPKTRNSQVGLYQSGDVDYLIATDAIGMGLNMDINEIYFSNLKKFDGKKTRRLNLIELSQIAELVDIKMTVDSGLQEIARLLIPMKLKK